MRTFLLAATARTTRDADHLLHRLADVLPLPEGAYALTHPVADPEPRLALCLAVAEDVADAVEGRLRAAGEEPTDLPEGPAVRRAVVFPGWRALTGSLTLGELFAGTAIARAEALGGVVPPEDAVLDTRGHVRPEWRDGELLLRLMPVRGGGYVPFEIPDPHPCCGTHEGGTTEV
ncbi:hypothetical protein [Streptomyces sp. SBT349]|uniref:hypothetical protein n=1 Tax=Streptomyces sp. SBT349 TaxID=1580539 RepID=UPI00066EC048|nr:hypothetical protein [Streptomyces sp. SBT349]